MNCTRLHVTIGCMLLGIVAAPALAHEEMSFASVRSNGTQGDANSGTASRSSISADGRHVAFESLATNLVSGDPNNRSDVFVHDRVTGKTTCMSVSAATGKNGNGVRTWPSISADGRYVAFQSTASNLVSNDPNTSVSDVFVRDRDPDGNGIFDEGNGVTTMVSVHSNGARQQGPSFTPSISADGTLVAFASDASTLITGDGNGTTDIFTHDMVTAVTTRVSISTTGGDPNAPSVLPSISADGAFVAFQSDAFNLVIGGDFITDVFVVELATLTTTMMSTGSGGWKANGGSFAPSISGDGSLVAFVTEATNLAAADLNGVPDVLVKDRLTGLVTRVSVDSAGVDANNLSESPVFSADGRFVMFQSDATNLVADDVDGATDVFVHELATGTTTAAAVDCAGTIVTSGRSFNGTLSSDGSVLVFTSTSTLLAEPDTNGVADVIVRDPAAALQASWSNYGAGWPGTLGIPTLTAGSDPAFGSTISIEVGSSLFLWNVGFMFAGLSAQSFPLRNSGTLLVGDLFLFLPIAIGPTGSAISGEIPVDAALCGVSVFLQVIELDDGATKGLSFTPGLELVIGH